RSPVRPREPRPGTDQAEPAAPVLPLAAESLRQRAVGYDERLTGGAIADEGIVACLILKQRLLKRRVLPPRVEAGGEWPGQQPLGFALPAFCVQPVARRRRNGEEIHTEIERRAADLRPL